MAEPESAHRQATGFLFGRPLGSQTGGQTERSGIKQPSDRNAGALLSRGQDASVWPADVVTSDGWNTCKG